MQYYCLEGPGGAWRAWRGLEGPGGLTAAKDCGQLPQPVIKYPLCWHWGRRKGEGGRSEVPAFSWSTVPRTAATKEKSGSIRREIDPYSSISCCWTAEGREGREYETGRVKTCTPGKLSWTVKWTENNLSHTSLTLCFAFG